LSAIASAGLVSVPIQSAAQLQFPGIGDGGSGAREGRPGVRPGGREERGRRGGDVGRDIGIGIGIEIGRTLQQGPQQNMNTDTPPRRKAKRPAGDKKKEASSGSPVFVDQDTDTVTGPKKPHKDRFVVTGGNDVPSKEIDCNGHKGIIDVSTDVTLTPTEGEAESEHHISISYADDNNKCDDCFWVQFIWREIVIIKKGKKNRKSATIHTTGGTYPLTDDRDPEHPNYNSDSAMKNWPGYEWNGPANVDEQRDTMFDRPSSGIDPKQKDNIVAEDQKDNGAENIVSKAHFDTFLVCGGKVCARVTWSVLYEWTSDEKDKLKGPTYGDVNIDPKGVPNTEQYRALVEKYTDGLLKY
jgi:hypothetical protein